MHLLVTDRLTCVRCGPTFGLVLVADDLRDRRLLEGFLGCSNCRDRYPVQGGFGDLRPAPRRALPSGWLESPPDPKGALRLAALLGVREGPGLLLLTSSSVQQAQGVAELVEGIEVVAVHAGLLGDEERPGVSRIVCGEGLPFFSGSLRGVVVEGPWPSEGVREAIRVLAPGARLVWLDPPAGPIEGLEAAGIELLMEAHSVLVGARKSP